MISKHRASPSPQPVWPLNLACSTGNGTRRPDRPPNPPPPLPALPLPTADPPPGKRPIPARFRGSGTVCITTADRRNEPLVPLVPLVPESHLLSRKNGNSPSPIYRGLVADVQTGIHPVTAYNIDCGRCPCGFALEEYRLTSLAAARISRRPLCCPWENHRPRPSPAPDDLFQDLGHSCPRQQTRKVQGSIHLFAAGLTMRIRAPKRCVGRHRTKCL